MQADSLVEQKQNQRRVVLWLLVLGAVGVVLFAPMMWQWRTLSDYEVHNGLIVQAVEQSGDFFRNTPHFIYHVAGAIPYALLPIDTTAAGALVMVLTYLGTMGVIAWQLIKSARSPLTNRLLLLFGFLTISLMLVMPINLFTPDNLYFGYFSSHVYHNPTVNMMKPFALLLFIAAVPLYRAKEPLSWQWLPAYALLTALCLLAKPSFVLAFLPALALLTLYRIIRRQAINWVLLIGGIVAPAGILLVYQTLAWTSGGGIGIDFLRVFEEWALHYEANAASWILPKLVFSIAFPLSVYLLNFRSASHDLMFNLGWLVAGVGIAYAYFMVDYTIVAAGDFGWSAQGGVFVLFVAATLFAVRHYTAIFQEQGSFTRFQMIALLVGGALLALHTIAGIHWYHLHRVYDPLALLYGVW